MAKLFLESKIINVVESYDKVQNSLMMNTNFIEVTEIYESGFSEDETTKTKVLINVNKIHVVRK